MASLADILGSKSTESLKKLAPKKSDTNSSSNKKSDTYHVIMPDFVAVDLETTGLDRKKDRITEIGMVQYINGKEVASYSRLVNPRREIPEFIVNLTGITNEAVADAPYFEDIVDEVLDFIGRLAICGHQVDFDFNFLNIELGKAGQKKLRNWQIDTLSTARMLLTNEEGYALGKVAKALGIELENAHRALDDAKASGEICLKLLPKLGELPPETRKKLAEFAPFSLTRKILENSVRNFTPAPHKRAKAESFASIEPIDPNFEVSNDQLNELFRTDGSVSNEVERYHYREEQESYAQIVAESLNKGTASAIEAGTGTGKSLGYLLPTSLWALNRGERVIISTNTKNLQDQLVNSSLPTVQKIVGEDLRFSSLKGRSNYLCKEGLEDFLSGQTGTVSVRERGAMMPLIKWADETVTGDIEELNSFNQNYHTQIWNLISAENKQCTKSCPHFNDCFMINAKKRANSSHIVVVNHALFYSDITGGSAFTGDAGALIIDEAHQLESSGHRMLRAEIDTKRIEGLTEFVQQLFNTINVVSKKSSDPQFVESVMEMKRVVKRLRKNHTQFLEELMAWGRDNESHAEEHHNKIAVISYSDRAFRSLSGLAGFKLALNDIFEIMEEIRQTGDVELADSVAFPELKSGIDQASQLRADLIYVTESTTEGDIFWMEIPENGKWIKLIGTTLDVAEFLGGYWKELNRPVIFTSATLSYKDNLDYFIKRIGAKDLSPVTAQFNTQFDMSNTLFLSRPDAPEPSGFDFVEWLSHQILAAHNAFEKNMMVLFTSNSLLNSVHKRLEKEFTHKKSPLFAQGISGNRAWIQQQMKEVRGAILLGSGSFWEGVDIPGDDCEIVIIPKLPFPVPSHPLAKALADQAATEGRNGFIDYHMPEALLKFKQGTGRLIRHAYDRGALLVLDSRMDSKSYGKRFVKLVNSDHVAVHSTDEMIRSMDSFFGDTSK